MFEYSCWWIWIEIIYFVVLRNNKHIIVVHECLLLLRWLKLVLTLQLHNEKVISSSSSWVSVRLSPPSLQRGADWGIEQRIENKQKIENFNKLLQYKLSWICSPGVTIKLRRLTLLGKLSSARYKGDNLSIIFWVDSERVLEQFLW